MRILSALALLIALCAGCTTPSARIPAASPLVVWSGRTLMTPDSCLRFNYPGVTARVAFEGPRLTMETSPGSGYWVVEVDSAAPRKLFAGPTDSVLTVADSLGTGMHQARITYCVEGYEYKPVVRGFAAASFGAATPPAGPRIEFIGNSITCGYGTEAADGTVRFSYDNENHTLTYAALTARTLDADANVVARSGAGVYRNYNGPREGNAEGTLPLEYEHALIYEPDAAWDFARFRPDIICINLGTNDTSTHNYDISLFEQACGRFVDRVQALNPGARIVLLTGSMMRGEELADATAALDRVAAERIGVYRFDMTPQDGSLGYGADWHPSAAQARKMADELTQFLKSEIIPTL